MTSINFHELHIFHSQLKRTKLKKLTTMSQNLTCTIFCYMISSYMTTFVKTAAVQANEYLHFIWHYHYLEPLRFCCFRHNLLSQCNQAGSHTKILALLWCQLRHLMPCMRLLIRWLRHSYRPCLHGQLECYLPQTCICKVTNDWSASMRSTLRTCTTILQHFWLQRPPW